MTRGVRILLAAGALAACGTADGDQAPPAAGEARPAAATERVDSVAVGPFRFVLHRLPTGVVDSVFVTRGGRRVQTLVPSGLEEHAILRDPTHRIDLDFDGHTDFGLVTLVPAAPNPAYDYWRYDPAADRFRYVGEYQMFEPDSATRTLGTHARGGHAGRTWSNSRWRWENGALVEFWRNEQASADGDRYVYSESELRGGRWVVVKADTMEDCEAEPLPEECQGPEASASPSARVRQIARIHPSLSRHAFTLHEGRPGVVDSIVVAVDGRRVQALRPGENEVPSHVEVERISAIDLDWDGHADLALLSEVGIASSRSQYWRRDPRTGRFSVAGEYETLTPDPAAREHTTFNRGGHGGRLWTAARWRWARNGLVPVAEEEQESVDADRRYVHVVRRRRGDRMEVVRADTLEGDAELRAGPSWMKP